MNRHRVNPFILIVLILGGLGLLYKLFTNPNSILLQVGLLALFAGGIYVVYKFVLTKRSKGSEYNAYMKAARRSKKRFNEQKASGGGAQTRKMSLAASSKKTLHSSLQKKKSKSNSHLTVIEGKKGKKKNRALF